ncbi:MAG TPA: LLM class flavin-dependent oxidoreductase, partial [Thermomicrobiales bacterium]|nr:LLM class flavin-dependent oxidoreductase [Thermomicrobiales bacterium]
LMDEGLDILTGLWQGQPFTYDGAHYKVQETSFNPPPPPVQQPRIPIWVVGAWPRQKSMQRTLRYDGLLPMTIGEEGARQATPDEVREMAAYIVTHRKQSTPFDIIVEGRTPGDDPAEAEAIIRPWVDAGATWWLEAMWDAPSIEPVRQRVRQGPPRLDRAQV